MAALHHLAATPGRTDLWRVFLAALAPGDIVILLDGAVAAAPAIAEVATDSRWQAVRWLVPEIELAQAAIEHLPARIEAIDDAHWWSLIACHDVLLEWN